MKMVSQNVSSSVIKIDEHLTINKELRDVNFCGKVYKMGQVIIDGVDVGQKAAEIINYNHTHDTFPKPDSGDKEYGNITEFARNMRYSFRPYKIAEIACTEFATSSTKTLDIQYLNTQDSGYYFKINTMYFLLKRGTSELYVSGPSEDQGGFGSWKINIPTK